MFSQIIEEIGESVTIVRLSADKDEESIISSEIMCVIDQVDDGKYENWKATLEKAESDIRKGDILKRDDGSELQVLRSVTQKDPTGEEITELDLKDYNQQEPTFQENEVDLLNSDLPEHELHPTISQKVWEMLLQGNYDPAVLQAFKELRLPSERRETTLNQITGFL